LAKTAENSDHNFDPPPCLFLSGFTCTFANLGALLPSIAGPIMVTDPNNQSVDPMILQTEIQRYLILCESMQ
jgi:hypothetical protein